MTVELYCLAKRRRWERDPFDVTRPRESSPRPCVKQDGHSGPHIDADGIEWTEFPNAGRCTICGWLRGVVALTTTAGDEPPPDIVVKTLCPQCGAVHTHKTLTDPGVAAALQSHMVNRHG